MKKGKNGGYIFSKQFVDDARDPELMMFHDADLPSPRNLVEEFGGHGGDQNKQATDDSQYGHERA